MEEKHILIPGQIYYVEEGSFWMIGRHIGGRREVTGNQYRDRAYMITSQGGVPEGRGWCYCDEGKRSYRQATPEEEAWFSICIEKGEYMEKEKALVHWTYSVY